MPVAVSPSYTASLCPQSKCSRVLSTHSCCRQQCFVISPTSQAGASKKQVDWGKEEVFFESAPHRGDLAVNIALGATLVWLPLSIAAIGRGAFVKYRFTDKRISVITSAPWKSELPS
jgi:hypothetical protein